MALTGAVANNDLAQPAWANEIRDRTCQVFDTVAQRDAQWAAPPNGALCVTLDTFTLWRRISATWVRQTGARVWTYAIDQPPAMATMNGNQDIAFSDAAGALPFPTVAVMTISALYLQPDRQANMSASIYSNSFTAPSTGLGRSYANTPIVASPGAGWTFLGGMTATQVLPANNPGIVWTLRFSGVTGGPTNYYYAYQLVLERWIV